MAERGAWPRAVLFDLEGTLADSVSFWLRTMRQVIGQMTGEYQEESRVLALHGPPEPVLLRGVLGAPKAKVAMEDVARLWRAGIRRWVPPVPGMVRVVEDLFRAGVPCGVVTGQSRRLAGPVLQRLGVVDALEVIVCGEDFPARQGPEGVLRALAQLGVAPAEAVFVGTGSQALLGARAARVPTVWLAREPRLVRAYPVDSQPRVTDAWALLDQLRRWRQGTPAPSGEVEGRRPLRGQPSP